MIAMAIACNPRLLIADEPTTALDATVQREILTLLCALQQRYRMAMLLVSHDLAMIAKVCRRVAVMKEGEIVECATAADVMQRPAHPYTRHLIECRNTPLGRVAAVSEPPQPILEVRNLLSAFVTRRNFLGKPTRRFTAVNNVSFKLFHGETLGLVGESGCGKSTLGRTIMNLTDNYQGEILFDNKPLQSTTDAVRRLRRDVQLIFQDPYSSLSPLMRIGDAIAEPMLYHGIFDTRKEAYLQTEMLLQKVGLGGEYMLRYPHQLSGGQRQRAVIARALAVRPKVLICDESVSALDVSVQRQVLELLRALQNEMGLSYLFISHDLRVVRAMCSRIMVMQGG
jgi:peptide/nickel transport system ATP-binding protein